MTDELADLTRRVDDVAREVAAYSARVAEHDAHLEEAHR